MPQTAPILQELPELPHILGSEKIAILGAILARNTPQAQAHAAKLCEQWGVELSSVSELAMRAYFESEAEQ